MSAYPVGLASGEVCWPLHKWLEYKRFFPGLVVSVKVHPDTLLVSGEDNFCKVYTLPIPPVTFSLTVDKTLAT